MMTQAFRLSGNKDEFIYVKLKTLKEVVEAEQKAKRMTIFAGLEGYHKQNQVVTDWRLIEAGEADGPSLQEDETPTAEWYDKSNPGACSSWSTSRRRRSCTGGTRCS